VGVEVPLERHLSISEGPRGHALIGGDFILDCNQHGVLVSGWRRRSMKSNRGPKMVGTAVSSMSRRDNASTAVLVLPTLYSIEKSMPSSLPTQWCWGMVAKC
jgi:hypothetical protein